MSPEELKSRARRIAQELLTQGDLAVAAELFAAECLHHAPWPLSPGADGARHWVTSLRRAFPDLYAVVEDEIAEEDTVVQRLWLGGTHQGPLFETPASGRRAAWEAVEMVRLGEGGVFIEHWVFWDQLEVLRQLDLEPP